MTVLVVGGDSLGKIPNYLKEQGYKEIIHWTGRSTKDKNKSIPENLDLVVVLCNYVNHITMNSVKKQAKERAIPMVFSKRAMAYISKSLVGI